MKARISNRRCDARVKYRGRTLNQYERGLVDRVEALRALRSPDRCRNWALPGSKRCRLHGGLSTGARTAEGKRRQAEGYRRWLERLRAERKKPGPAKGTGGRPRSSWNPLPESKAKRQLADAITQHARARLMVRHAVSSSSSIGVCAGRPGGQPSGRFSGCWRSINRTAMLTACHPCQARRSRQSFRGSAQEWS